MDPIAQIQSALTDRYAVERELGRGGMATVFLARDLRHTRPVAVKVMTPEMVSSVGSERFLREIGIAARLTHPHILGVHDSGEANGLLYYVMPYVEGETLRARIAREGALPLADAVRFLRELADALAYAHTQGVVHRDLKPENVLLSGGHAVVADFGIAKAVAAATGGQGAVPTLTGTGVSMGTPAYMAPEQAVGDRNADHRADLYALGVVAYEMIAGDRPFGSRTPQGFAAAHLAESATPVTVRRPDVPRALGELIGRLLAKEPAARPQSAAEVVWALDAVSGARAAPRSVPRGTRTMWMAAAVVLLIAAVVFALRGRLGSRVVRPIRAVAVLPFVNTSGNQADEYFSDGLTDELASALTRLRGLQVAGRTGSYSFKGKTATAPEIGRVLDVDALVEGTVRRGGDDRLRVTTRLVSATDGKVLWDSVYESQSTDVFGVQDQFTRAVVTALAPMLEERPAAAVAAVDVGRGTTDPEAYQLYLQGRYYWLARGGANVHQSIDYFKQAIARDANFARAHAGLALAYSVLPVYEPDPRDTLRALQAASASRAMALDSTLADAQIAMADALRRDPSRAAEAMARDRRAIELDPTNASAYHSSGFFLLGNGQTDEAISQLQRATQLDPLAKSAWTALGLAYAFARRADDALAASRRVLAMDSTFGLAYLTLGVAHLVAGRADSAVRVLERLRVIAPQMPDYLAKLAFAYAVAGRWNDLERLGAELRRPGADHSGGVESAYTDFLLGDAEPLLRVLGSDAGGGYWLSKDLFGCNPLLDPVWADRRFAEVMKMWRQHPCPVAQQWPGVPRGARG